MARNHAGKQSKQYSYFDYQSKILNIVFLSFNQFHNNITAIKYLEIYYNVKIHKNAHNTVL